MRFGAWVRLCDAAGVAPVAAGVLQVRREIGLVEYPRGKSAMILYAAADDLRGACVRLAAQDPGMAWLVRWNRDPVGDPAGAVERLIAEFVERFGGAPELTKSPAARSPGGGPT